MDYMTNEEQAAALEARAAELEREAAAIEQSQPLEAENKRRFAEQFREGAGLLAQQPKGRLTKIVRNKF